MGAAAVRITAADFVVPPEFADFRSKARSTAQIGGVRLELVRAGTTTRLGSCYQQVPVRVLPPFHFAGDPAALLYLLNPTAGLLDGDAHLYEITVGAGACLVISGQSATRIHPCWQGFSTQQWRVRVADGGRALFLPGPAIPFRGCRYFQRVRIDLAPGALLAWADIWFPGRYGRDEPAELFQFDHMVQDLEVQRDHRLIYRDRFAWRGPWSREAAAWHFGHNLASAALFITGAVELADTDGGTQLARLRLDSGDTCMRWCGSPAEVVKAAVTTALAHAGQWTSSAFPWLLGTHNLGPNHWFSA